MDGTPFPPSKCKQGCQKSPKHFPAVATATACEVCRPHSRGGRRQNKKHLQVGGLREAGGPWAIPPFPIADTGF